MLIAKLGGYIGRKGDRPPGHHTIAKGLRRLSDLTMIVNLGGNIYG